MVQKIEPGGGGTETGTARVGQRRGDWGRSKRNAGMPNDSVNKLRGERKILFVEREICRIIALRNRRVSSILGRMRSTEKTRKMEKIKKRKKKNKDGREKREMRCKW